MDHYDHDKWVLFRNNRIEASERRLMEDHLAGCERCLRCYLAAGGEDETALAEVLLPPDFNIALKAKIRAEKQQANQKRRSRSLINYTVAAAITLVLMSSGMFDLCARELPGLFTEKSQLSRVLQRTDPWDSGRLLDTVRIGIEKLRGSKEE